MNVRKFISSYVKAHLIFFIFVILVLEIISGIVKFSYYPLLENAINTFADNRGNNLLLLFLGIFVVLNLCLSFLCRQAKSAFYADMEKELHIALMEKFWKLPAFGLNDIAESECLEANNKVYTVTAFLQSKIAIFISCILFFMASLYIVLFVSPLMLLIEFGLMLLMFCVNIICKPITGKQNAVIQQEKEIMSDVQSVYNGIEIIKVYFMEHVMQKKYTQNLAKLTRMNTKIADYQNLIVIVQQCVQCLVMVLIPFVTVLLNGQNTGNAVIAMFLFFFLMNQVTTVLGSVMNYNQAKASLSCIDRILAKDEPGASSTDKSCQLQKISELKIDNMSIGYGEGEFRKNVKCSFKAGGINVIVGESGSGKSTFLKTLAGLLPCSDCIQSMNGQKYDIRELKSHMIYVPQQFYYVPGSVERNIQLALQGNVLRRFDEAHKQIFGQAERFWINNPDIEELSGGQKQVINIIRGLLSDRDIILMDEPTSSLSIKRKESFVAAMEKLAKNKLVVIATHDKEIISHADNVIGI